MDKPLWSIYKFQWFASISDVAHQSKRIKKLFELSMSAKLKQPMARQDTFVQTFGLQSLEIDVKI